MGSEMCIRDSLNGVLRDLMEMGIYCVSDQDCNVNVEHPDGQQYDSVLQIPSESYLNYTGSSNSQSQTVVVTSNNPIVIKAGRQICNTDNNIVIPDQYELYGICLLYTSDAADE